MKKCQIISHTADIRVRISAKTTKDLFVSSAVCLFKLLTGKKFKAKKTKNISLSAQNLEDLLVLWLNELISIFYSYKFLPVTYKASIASIDGEKVINAVLKGQDFDPYNNKSVKCEIKAATYHNLKIKKNKSGVTAEIVFDV